MTTSAQLRIEPTPTIPLDQALRMLAEQWSVRIGEDRTLTGNPWMGWSIGPVKQ